MVAPPWMELPPTAYGGIESMCADLAEQLDVRGLDVTLIGVGRDQLAVKFVSTQDVPRPERLGQALPEVVHAAALPDILDSLDVDLVHDHTMAGPLLARSRSQPTVVTTHGPVTGEMGEYYRRLGDHVCLVAVSEAQRRIAPHLNWAGTVHNAVRVEQFPFERRKDGFALFLGRSCPEKGIRYAIEAAGEAGLPLVIAAKCREPDEIDYFRREVEPRLRPGVEWLGEVGGERKLELLAAARCLIFPVCWDEPFGLVMAEAMACGTPVIALRRGSIPEVVTHGATGYICDRPAELPDALRAAGSLSPERCRAEARSRFDVDAMAEGYQQIYQACAGP